MGLQSGVRLGSYEIVAPLGAGGMGEVYRARDTKLGRDVALKLLPDVFANDPHRVARFEREAQLLATLNHPHIGAIYGILETSAAPALVLEFVDGPTLADRINQGPIPLEEALPIARQIAEALEAAHELGIVHRDLKPANIKLREDGTVKVLDFGLATMLETERAVASLTASPTLSAQATREGIILGTAAYMSPEQARGKLVDRRTDLWAFGCVLYEMLTGKRPFEAGETVSDAIAGILKGDLDWAALPAATPESIRRLLRRCLEKERHRRLQSAGDARVELEDARAEPEGPKSAAVGPAAPRRGERLAWIAAVLVLTAVAGTLAVPYLRAPVDAPEMRVDIVTPATSDPTSFAISPDGRRLAFAASGDGQTRLWLRPLDTTTAQPLAGTEGASYPFWSPDSRSVAFFASGKLKRLDIGAGQPQTLADVAVGRGGSWSAEGVILFSRANTGPLYRVPAAGGEAVAATNLGGGQVSHRFPQFLPGGRQFLYYNAQAGAGAQGIYLASLDSADTKRVTAADSAGAYASGWLLFIRQGTLVARRLDLTRGELTGDPATIADPVGNVNNAGAFSVSASGPVMYRTGGADQRQLTWFDRSGNVLETLGAQDSNNLSAPVISPDGRRVAVQRTVQGNQDIWLIDGVRTTRFTTDPSADAFPIWSPDGTRIVFRSNRKGPVNFYQKLLSGAGVEEPLLESPQTKTPNDWSPDGRFLLYGVNDDPKTGYDLWVLPLEGDRKPFVFLNAGYEERTGQFSPDGHWVAYVSTESGRHEVYVRPFPGPGGQLQVSTSGGIQPKWRSDSQELYYIAPDAKLMATPITVKGTTIEPGAPVALFQTRIWGGGTESYNREQYDVARDGRILINVSTEDAAASPITLVLNWKPKP